MAALTNIATKTTYGLLTAAAVSGAPKAVGTGFRIWDDRKAPWHVEKETIKRELATVGQVSFYGAAIKLADKRLTRIAERMTAHGESNLLSTGLQKLHANQALFLIGLSCTANFIAETVSRKLAPRNIWNKPEVDVVLISEPAEKPAAHSEKGATDHSEKAKPLFQARKPQPVPFSSRGAAPVVPNPFQVVRAIPPVVRPTFSV